MSGVISRGVRAPIIREGDDIVAVVTESVLAAMRAVFACVESSKTGRTVEVAQG